MRTGALQSTVTVGKPLDYRYFLAVDGWLYDVEEPGGAAPYRLRATDLRSGASAVVFSATGHEFTGMDVCGRGRLCVLDKDRDDRTRVTAVDVAGRRQIWRVAGPAGAGSISSLGGTTLVGGGGTTVLFDAGGRSLFRTPAAHVDWLTPDRLLVMPALAAGTVMTVRIADRELTRLGDVPQHTGVCVHTTDRLACPTGTDLRVFRLTG